MDARRRVRSLKPSFVVVVAAAAAATIGCGALESGFGSRGSPDDRPSKRECERDDECFSNNPPPPMPEPPPRPEFGSTVTQEVAPPPLGAASLITTSDGATAVATDPDRDRVVAVDLATAQVHAIALEPGDEPGRIVEGSSNQVHVVLDRAGHVATIDLATSKVVHRRAVCAAPSGIARDGATLYVACTGGEIMTLPEATDGAAERLARVDRDLRDIVVVGDSLFVSRLRRADVLRIRKADGVLLSRGTRKPVEPNGSAATEPLEPFVGWRLVAGPSSEGVVLVHQMAEMALLDAEQPRAYASLDPCRGLVRTALTMFAPDGNGRVSDRPGGLLGDAVAAVDLAISPDGKYWVAIAAGNGHTPSLPQIHLLRGFVDARQCAVQPSSTSSFGSARPPTIDPPGQAVAAAFAPNNDLLVFTREPAAIHRRSAATLDKQMKDWETIALGGASREDTGHAVFHSNTGGRVACVSCHPGGGDDGRVWQLSSGPRRTQSLQGTLEGTAPYHWNGDVAGIESVATEVFVQKMGGQELDTSQVDALRSWVTRIPAPLVSSAVDADASARGKMLFEDTSVGCSSCHAGPKLATNESVDIGTGGTFQVPSLLGLSLRAPFLHDGRALKLLDAVGPNGGADRHGKTSQLTDQQREDLATYLETL